MLALLFCVSVPAFARGKSKAESYGGGLMVSVPAVEQELLQAVQDVAADGVIQGSKEYNKDEYVAGAEAADNTSVFPKWSGPGQVFYKIKRNALDPRNFQEGGDSGTLAVRYVVQHGDDKNTGLKIDAVFVDDFHHHVHLSNGSVEGAEYKEIQDHLEAMHLKQAQGAENEKHRQQELVAREAEAKRKQELLENSVARHANESQDQYVARLRHEAERIVGAGGAQLKSAPFKSATSLASLPAGAKVAILITTAYWYGIETEDGQHGWIHRSQLEQLP
jgi:hypothetical protein